MIDWFGALGEASARTEGISNSGREVRARLYAQFIGSDTWHLLTEWRQQDNSQFGTMSLSPEWRMANSLPDAPVKALSAEVAVSAFANCDNDVTGRAWGSVALYEVLVRGHGAFPGDVNLDGQVNLDDFGLLKGNFGEPYRPADFDQSGQVDLSDFGALEENFGTSYLAEAVPEPSTWSLAALGALLQLGLRRGRKR